MPVIAAAFLLRWIYAPDPRIATFFEAVETGDAAKVSAMLEDAYGLALAGRGRRRTKQEPVTMSGETPLHAAAAAAGRDGGHYQISRLLILKGADVNALKIRKTPSGVSYTTPLLELAGNGGINTPVKLKILELLLAEGAATDYRDGNGNTVLGLVKEVLAFSDCPDEKALNESAAALLKKHGAVY